MKTVITSSGKTTDSDFDKRFGRADFFCVFDNETNETSFIENIHKDSSNAAGTKAAEVMVELGVSKVISGDFGPKAKTMLEKFDIQMVIIQGDGVKINDLIKKLS